MCGKDGGSLVAEDRPTPWRRVTRWMAQPPNNRMIRSPASQCRSLHSTVTTGPRLALTARFWTDVCPRHIVRREHHQPCRIRNNPEEVAEPLVQESNLQNASKVFQGASITRSASEALHAIGNMAASLRPIPPEQLRANSLYTQAPTRPSPAAGQPPSVARPNRLQCARGRRTAPSLSGLCRWYMVALLSVGRRYHG